jgi:hypothetical protein
MPRNFRHRHRHALQIHHLLSLFCLVILSKGVLLDSESQPQSKNPYNRLSTLVSGMKPFTD